MTKKEFESQLALGTLPIEVTLLHTAPFIEYIMKNKWYVDIKEELKSDSEERYPDKMYILSGTLYESLENAKHPHNPSSIAWASGLTIIEVLKGLMSQLNTQGKRHRIHNKPDIKWPKFVWDWEDDATV